MERYVRHREILQSFVSRNGGESYKLHLSVGGNGRFTNCGARFQYVKQGMTNWYYHLSACVLLAWLAHMPSVLAADYPWQQPHATVLPHGGIEWAPQQAPPLPTHYAWRYIDYAAGDDANDGTREQPWKHHPWDRQATGQAAAFHGSAVYVFKRGVTYYGSLVASSSGSGNEPIILTSVDDWGTGAATISAAMPVDAPWELVPANIFERDHALEEGVQLWRASVDLSKAPNRLWRQQQSGALQALPLARHPNEQPGKDPRLQRGDWATWKRPIP